jgi:cell fate (sporulation/competence/biofilm development) regulator YmcA (YheA/YmcA/DUF963 family)
METLATAIKCTQCKQTLESPVILPCSDSICKKHVKDEAREFHCLQCDIIHAVPTGGFLKNKALAILLVENIQKNKFHPQYESAFDSFKNLEKSVDKMKLLHKDPFYLINEAIGELKRVTDLLRDEFKLKIDREADAIIKELNEYEKACKSNLDSADVSKNLENLAANIDEINDKMDKWQKALRNFEPRETEWKVIQEKCAEYKKMFDLELNAYRDDFLMKKLNVYQQKLLSFCTIKLESDRKYVLCHFSYFYFKFKSIKFIYLDQYLKRRSIGILIPRF